MFHADDAVAEAQKGERVVLVRVETSPEDIHGMTAAQGILTARGGMTSHAAVVARGMGKCCVAGAGSINVDYGKQQMSVNVDGKLVVVKKGDVHLARRRQGRGHRWARCRCRRRRSTTITSS